MVCFFRVSWFCTVIVHYKLVIGPLRSSLERGAPASGGFRGSTNFSVSSFGQLSIHNFQVRPGYGIIRPKQA